MRTYTIEELREKVREAEDRKRVALAAECIHAGDTLASAEEYWEAMRDRGRWRRRLAAAEKRAATKREATRDVWNGNIRLHANSMGQ